MKCISNNNIMQTYYIYYLPNAVRDYSNGKIHYGKIGCAVNYKRRVLEEKSHTRKFGQLDITGHHILETVYGTKADAEAIEAIWQENFILIDGNKLKRNEEARKNMSNALRGISKSANHKQKLRETALNKPKSECLYCGKMVDNAVMARLHGNKCKSRT